LIAVGGQDQSRAAIAENMSFMGTEIYRMQQKSGYDTLIPPRARPTSVYSRRFLQGEEACMAWPRLSAKLFTNGCAVFLLVSA
jgi:hypothetical protein